MIWGVELNPGMQMEEKLSDFMVEQREEKKGIREWYWDNENIKEQERIKGHVNSWETKMRKMEEEHNIMEEWRRRNNTVMFGIEEFLH